MVFLSPMAHFLFQAPVGMADDRALVGAGVAGFRFQADLVECPAPGQRVLLRSYPPSCQALRVKAPVADFPLCASLRRCLAGPGFPLLSRPF